MKPIIAHAPISFHITEKFQPRSVQFHEACEFSGWLMKIYSVVYGDNLFEWKVFEEFLPTALSTLPQPAVTESRPGVGFVIAHQGRGMNYLILNWWDNENELFNRVFKRTFGNGEHWHLATEGETTCVWDLEVIWFEREAYVNTVLKADSQNIQFYLRQKFSLTK
jgi:hypothetical protein